jgi:multisubunit Na+/H+ antiporter MnhB subunit
LTVVTGFHDGKFQWEYFNYFWYHAWGVPYAFPYTLPVVIAYLAAYACGIATYLAIRRSGSPRIGLAGVVLCGVGFASFAFELSHWFVDHSRSWIASAPVAALVLALVAAVQQIGWRPALPPSQA